MNDYILRNIPAALWLALKHRAVDEGLTIKALILRAITEYLEAREEKKR